MKIKILGAVVLLFFAMNSHAQGGGGQRGGDPVQRAEMQTKMMVDSLSLSSKQSEKVKEINLKYATEMKEARSQNPDGDREKMRSAMDALRTEQYAALKTVLTKEQYDHWLKIGAEMGQRRGGRGQDGNEGQGRKGKKGTPPPPPPPPAPEQGGN